MQALQNLEVDLAVDAFPNISAVDLSLVIKTVDSVLGKVTFVVRFMALFSILTGLVVLTGAVLSGRFQRLRESVLLRTLGASRRQIVRIFLVEYLMLGWFAAITGLLLALPAPLQWIFWIPTIGTWVQIIFGYCTMARLVSTLPWNRSEGFSLAFLSRTFLSRPVRGNILQGQPAIK